MAKWKRHEIELTPVLLKKLFEHVKAQAVGPEDLDNIISNLYWLSKSDETLTIEEFDQIIKKSTVV
jgi:hypothetical protein